MWIAIALLLAADAPLAPDDALPAALSLPQAEELFLAHGLDVLIAEAAARGAEGDLKAAGAHPNPGLDLSALYVPPTTRDLVNGSLGNNSTAATWGFQVGVTDNAAIEDALSGKHSLRVETLSRALAAARLGIDDVKRVELSQLRQAYVAAVMAKLNLDSTQDSLDTYDKQLKLNQIRFEKGAINGLDLSRILQAQLEGLQAVDQAESGLQQAIATVEFLLGVRSGPAPLTLTTGIDHTVLPQLSGASVASLYALALQHRTDVHIGEATLQQKLLVEKQARRAVLPDVALQLSYGEQCNSQTCSSAPTFGVGLQGNLPVFYQQQGEIQRAESDALAAERSLEKAKAQVLSEVTQGFAGYVAADRLVARMEAQLLAQATQSRDLAELMYQKGAASLLDFLDAQRTYVGARLEYHQDLASYWASVYALEQATGVPLH